MCYDAEERVDEKNEDEVNDEESIDEIINEFAEIDKDSYCKECENMREVCISIM